MKITSVEKKRLEIKKSRNGRGLFAKISFAPDQKILQIVGEFVSCDVDEDIDEETRSNTFRFDEERYISPKGRVSMYVNHSCNPNAKLVKDKSRLFIVALAPVSQGDEITFDYSTTLASDDVWTMTCNCGEKNCRKVIKQFVKLPKSLQKKYISLDMVPSYIF